MFHYGPPIFYQLDGVNTLEIGLFALRSKVAVIAQEPVLFSGSVRFNLDPFGDYGDDLLFEALRRVRLGLPALFTRIVLCFGRHGMCLYVYI